MGMGIERVWEQGLVCTHPSPSSYQYPYRVNAGIPSNLRLVHLSSLTGILSISYVTTPSVFSRYTLQLMKLISSMRFMFLIVEYYIIFCKKFSYLWAISWSRRYCFPFSQISDKTPIDKKKKIHIKRLVKISEKPKRTLFFT